MLIEVGKTYAITGPGGPTYGTVTAVTYDKGARETIVNHRSDHPEAETVFWARPSEVAYEVPQGTYLGDDGQPVLP
jgi:hypothetical protein